VKPELVVRQVFCLAILTVCMLALGSNALACDFPDCHSLQQQHDALLKEIVAIQQSPNYIQGKNDPHPGAPDPESLLEVKALWKQVAILNQEISKCILSHGGKPALNSTFEGTATLTTTHPDAPGPFTVPVSFGLLFDEGCHSNVEITNFPSIDVGNGAATVTKVAGGSGTYNPATGAMWLFLTLDVDPSNALATKSDIPLDLSTENPWGVRLPIVVLAGSKGHITLTGTGTFQGGHFDGSSGTLVVADTISPHP
jgi:hypothetical protein